MYHFRIACILFSIPFFILASCQEASHPKPDAFLALNYPTPQYKEIETACPYHFEINQFSKLAVQSDCGFEIHYPSMKATVFVNYRSINHNLKNLLHDAQKLTYEHVIKADEIIEQPYINENRKVYGMFYEVAGDAATNAQFYATDSIQNFIFASLYFYTKPNYDSILPAVDYVKNDMRKLMESLEWRNEAKTSQ